MPRPKRRRQAAGCARTRPPGFSKTMGDNPRDERTKIRSLSRCFLAGVVVPGDGRTARTYVMKFARAWSQCMAPARLAQAQVRRKWSKHSQIRSSSNMARPGLWTFVSLLPASLWHCERTMISPAPNASRAARQCEPVGPWAQSTLPEPYDSLSGWLGPRASRPVVASVRGVYLGVAPDRR
jgi:hypothetical protein